MTHFGFWLLNRRLDRIERMLKEALKNDAAIRRLTARLDEAGNHLAQSIHNAEQGT